MKCMLVIQIYIDIRETVVGGSIGIGNIREMREEIYDLENGGIEGGLGLSDPVSGTRERSIQVARTSFTHTVTNIRWYY